MVLFETLASAAAANVWGQLSTEDYIGNVGVPWSVTGRSMMADQILTRKYFEYEMRIARQGLHRDDIRDLMELTVGRMDVYHVVGTLILTFCITWFTDAQILEADVPPWFRTIFLLSNFSAVGYLILSVWLAMHASIAAHSVGVRLLTSFARLSIPSHEELKKMRITYMPKLDEIKSAARQKFAWLRSKMGGGDAEEPEHFSPLREPSGLPTIGKCPHTRAAAVGAAGALTMPSVRRFTSAAITGPDVDPGEDDTQHFIRYCAEQRKWLGYDAYARVCMSMGMNQMLQALSYYVVGVLSRQAFTAGVTAFFGVKAISFLLLKLDFSEMGHDWWEYGMVVFFMVVPTISACASFLVLDHVSWEGQALKLMVAPCFILHGFWILYVGLDFRPQHCFRHRGWLEHDHLPSRIRTVNYLGVCDLRQRELAKRLREEEVQAPVAALRDAREEADSLLQELSREDSNWTDAVFEALKSAQVKLNTAIEEANAKGVATAGKAPKSELNSAIRTCSKLELFQQAPEILAMLRGLRDEKVAFYLTEAQKASVEESYQEFLQECRNLNVSVPETSNPETVQRIRVNPQGIVDDPAMPDSLWVNPADGSVTWSEPERDTSFATAVREEAIWRERAKSLASKRRSSSASQALEISSSSSSVAAPVLPGVTVAAASRDLLPPGASPDQLLPRSIVTSFTVFTAVWWMLAGVLHVAYVVSDGRTPSRTALETARVGKLWPQRREHCSFLEVAALSCNGSHLLLADRFTHFVAQHSPALSPLSELGEAGVASELSFHRGPAGGASLQLPSHWRMAATAWEPCLLSEGCEREARIAAWDGASVLLAEARLTAPRGSWQVKPRFRVHPGISDGNASGSYDDVLALHLRGEKLMVLQKNGLLDAWNLTAGSRERYRLGEGFVAVCAADERRLLLVRQGRDGPVLEETTLPGAAAGQEAGQSPLNLAI